MFKIFSFLLGVAFVVFLGATANNINKRELTVDIESINRIHPEYNINEENITREFSNSLLEIEPIEEPIEELAPPRGVWVWAKVTAYTPGVESCGSFADGKTSIGVNTRSINPNHIYGIAVDPSEISYGTYIYVPEYWESLQNNTSAIPSDMTKADDTGASMRNFRPYWRTVNGERVLIQHHIDIRYRTVRAARNWGVRYMRIFIYF